MHDGTRVVRAGRPQPAQGEPFLPGPCFAATYHLSGDPSTAANTYGRSQNPTWTLYENAIGELESGIAIAFASGMGAVAAIFGSVLRPGDVLILPTDGYYTARLLAEGFFTSMGVKVRLAPTARNAQSDFLAGAKLLWLETPSNPGLEVCDIAELCEKAHRVGALVAVDNTTPTMLGQRPLDLGADFSIASDTKALLGHSDLLMGHVAVRDPAWAKKLITWRTQIGSIPGPMEVWLAHRSLATLDLRLERMNANALAIAQFLCGRSEVKRVRYPGLPNDPSHGIAVKQMTRFGPILSFEFPGRTEAERWLSNCKLVDEATSFGSVHTTAERRARWGADQVAEGFIRFSAGCEHIDDLIADMTRAFEE